MAIWLFMVVTFFTAHQNTSLANNIDNPSFSLETPKNLTLEKKVGQLLWLEVSDKTKDLEGLLKKYNPAGINIRSNDPLKIKHLAAIAANHKGAGPVLVQTDISALEGIVVFPDIKTMDNILDEDLIQQYKDATRFQMEILGIDRETRYGEDLGLSLIPGPGHYQTLKKAIFESDGIIVSGDLAYWYDEIYRMVKSGEIPASFFEKKVEKVLNTKEKVLKQKDTAREVEDYLLPYYLNSGIDKALNESLYLRSFLVYKNEHGYFPVPDLINKRFLHLSNTNTGKIFNRYLNYYYPVQNRHFSELSELHKMDFGNFDHVFLELSGPVGIEDANLLQNIDAMVRLTVIYLGEFNQVVKLKQLSSVLWNPEKNTYTASISPQILFGGLSPYHEFGEPVRLSYTAPETAGMDSRTLDRIDALVDYMIRMRATPGCQILVAKNGHVVYNKSFGSLFYNDSLEVTGETLYDLASITKVMATLPAVMYLDQNDLLDIDSKASDYLVELQGTNKEDVIIRNILLHQAGLYPYLPFWRQTVNEYGPMPELYSHHQENPEWKQVSTGLYSNTSLQDSLWKWTVLSRMRKLPKGESEYDYKYSDLGFYILKELVERVSGMTLNSFSEKYLYAPIGSTHLTFLPLKKFSRARIAPTEFDHYFRDGLIQGTVHDQTAAMFGGVAGHAGLFSNSNDLAKVMQMFLWNGSYGGTQYFSPEILHEYSERQNADNRRGLGWDKPDPEGIDNTSYFASFSSFGHTGFTGTSVWADPEFDLLYVFLSNRVHPDANNDRLGRGNFRTRIQDIIYRAIQNYEKEYVQ